MSGAGAGGEDTQLAADVKAFAAQLGLASGGAFPDGFDDFAPDKAGKRIGGGDKPKKVDKKQQAGKQQQQQSAAGGAVAGRRQDGKQQQGDRWQKDGGKQQRQGDGQHQQGGRWQKDGGQQQQQRKPWQKDGQQQEGGRWQKDGGQQQRKPWQQQQGGGSWDEEEPTAAAKVPNAKSILPRDEPTIWHEAASTLPALPASAKEPAPELVKQRHKQAAHLLLVEEQAFEQNIGRRSSADAKWMQQVRRTGTTADKVAAMSVLVQDGVVANLASLDGLVAMVGKKGGARDVVRSAMDALKELFTTVLLPDRKLRYFEQQPLDKVEAGREGERRLLYWLLEDGIKKRYATFVEGLEACSRDSLDFVKDRAIKTLFELLLAKPEQEARLLGALVNKLGDPDRKLASKVGYLLSRLLAEHPGMSVPVVREIERFLFRPGLQDRARYYAVVYLNQMVLSHRQPQQTAQGSSLARRLIDVYFTLFKMVLDGKIGTAAQLSKQQQDKAAEQAAKRKRGEAAKARAAEAARQKAAEAAAATAAEQTGEMDGRMLSALITGVRRAFPYVPAEEVEPLIEAHADALFRLVHARSFGVATQALLLLFQLMASRSTVSDRFYRALYAVLGSPELHRSTKAPMFLSLLFKALKADVSGKRAAAFAKRLLQVAQESPPHFACGCLLLTSELLKARPALWGAVLQPEEGEADGLERFQDAPEDGPDGADGQQQAAAAAGVKGGRKVKRKGGRGSAKAEGGTSEEEEEEELGGLAAGSSSEEEEEGAEEDGGDQDLMPGLRQQQAAVAAAVAARAVEQAAADVAAAKWPASKDAYDMHKREPQFSNADRSCLWELTSLAAHVHPSVAAMARTLLAGQSVLYDGDPLRDLTLGAFLEKFVQKKAKAATKGDSAMQRLPAAAADAAAAGPQQWAALAGAQTQALAALAEKDVRPDDLFFHKYYSLQAVQDKAARRRRKAGGDDELLSDAESDDSDAADDFLVAEEEGGDDGIGADPDRAGKDYDYADLAAAMDSGDDSGDDSDAAASDSDAAGSDSDVEGGSDDVAAEELSGSEGEEGGSGSEEGGSGEEPEGAAFSDMSEGSEEEEGEEEGDLVGGSSGSEEQESEDDGFEAELAREDLSDEDESDSSSEEEDVAAADAEVAELMRRNRIRPLPAGGDGSDEDLNPFDLAEASSSDDEAAAEAPARGSKKQKQEKKAAKEKGGAAKRRAQALAEAEADSSSDDGEEPPPAAMGGGKRRKRSDDPMAVFASADDYAAMIEKDLQDRRGLDDGTGGGSDEEQVERGSGRTARPRQQQQRGGRGGRGGRPPKRQQDGGGGGGRTPKRQQWR